MQTLDSSVAAAQIADRHAAAAAFRAARDAATPPLPSPSRPARTSCCAAARRGTPTALTRLAQLDGAPRPAGAMLVAELDGEIVAAVPFDGGRAIADPFRPTAALVELLHARTRLLADAAPGRRLRRFRPRTPRLRIAA